MCDLWGTLKSRERTCSLQAVLNAGRKDPHISGPWDQDGPP